MEHREYTARSTENGRVLLLTDIHNNGHDYYGVGNDPRMDFMCCSLAAQYEKSPFDAVFCLGDYSLDFWEWGDGGSFLHDPPVSRTRDFAERFLPRFPAETFIIPGNHEQYGSAKWAEITGADREYSVVYGEHVFAMLDTFADGLDPAEDSDGIYSGVNTEYLREILASHPDKDVLLCAHFIDFDRESEEFRELVQSEPRIRAAFTGHIHISTAVVLGESWRNLPVFFCGNYSYHRTGRNDSGRYYGNVFGSFVSGRSGCWGFRVLELGGGRLCTDYVRTDPAD